LQKLHDMGKNKIFWVLTLLLISLIFYYNFSGSSSSKNELPSREYTDRLKKEREGKDSFFKENENSPIADKANFKGLHYFEPNKGLIVTASLTLAPDTNKVFLQTTGGKVDTLTFYGRASFVLANKAQTLNLYHLEGKTLFVPFRDATSGKASYGGGRYLDVSVSNILGNKIELDFNQAYHPYCAYNKDYVCPIPPKENTLSVAIEAGEKL
jgi:uncharacterized protein